MSELFPVKTFAIEVISCTDPTREGELNWWYDKVHIPTLRQIPGIQSVHRYRDMQPNLDEKEFGVDATRYAFPKERGNRYLTWYRIYSDDPWGLMQKIKEDDKKKAEQGKMIDCMNSWELGVWSFYACRKSVLPLAKQQRPPTNLPDGMPEVIFVFGNIRAADPAFREAYDDYWLYTHSHDLCEYPGWVQANRYFSLNPKPAENEATAMNIYELDHDDPVVLLKQILRDDRDIRRPQGRFLVQSRGAPPTPQAITSLAGLYQHWDIMSANFT
jgi:hypothetical protein